MQVKDGLAMTVQDNRNVTFARNVTISGSTTFNKVKTVNNKAIIEPSKDVSGSQKIQIVVGNPWSSFTGSNTNDSNTWSISLEGQSSNNTTTLVLWYEGKMVANFKPNV